MLLRSRMCLSNSEMRKRMVQDNTRQKTQSLNLTVVTKMSHSLLQAHISMGMRRKTR